jgi:integrase
VRHPRTGKTINPRQVIGGPDTFATRREASFAEDEARRILRSNARAGVTVYEWWETWTTDPIWQRPSQSTNIHYRERTSAFVTVYGDIPMRLIGDDHVAAWLKGGRNLGTVAKLRTMWNDAATAAAGRIVDRNPWQGLRLPARPRRDRTPPGIDRIAHLIQHADELTPPSFAAYLDVACHQGMRPGELDALRWTKIDFQQETIVVDEQWNKKTRTFTKPKHHHVRTIALTDPARERLLALPHETEFAFTTLNGSHYTASSRDFHWNRARCAAGLGNVDLYSATRHYFAWYAWNVLELDERDIALHLGHQDGGKLVRMTYGHAEEALARERIRNAYRQAPPAPVPLVRAS